MMTATMLIAMIIRFLNEVWFLAVKFWPAATTPWRSKPGCYYLTSGQIIAPHLQEMIWGRHPDCGLGMRSLCPVSAALIRFVCWPSGRLWAGLPVRSATWSSRRITATACGRIGPVAFIIRGESALIRHHYLFTHLLPYDYPDLVLSGGEGVAVLRTARAAADRLFRQSRR